MIYTSTKNKTFIYRTPLIDYIKKNNLYINENLIYTKKYTEGTFSITNPTIKFKNCKLVNGYPHFNLPLDIILDEINFFIKGSNMYDKTIFIRYGDTHPNKAIPKLAQVRNLIVNSSLNSMIGNSAESRYVLGDISIKTLDIFSEKYALGITGEKLFVDLVNNNLIFEKLKLLNEFNKDAMNEINQFLYNMQLPQTQFVVESELYKNQELYQNFKFNPNYQSELKKNGELKYTLQEIMFIKSTLKNSSNSLISIIGSNQSDHIKRVNEIMANQEYKLDSRFLSYGICRNGDSTNVDKWSSKLISFIEKNNLTQNGEIMDYRDFLKVLMLVTSNDRLLDFDNLDKHVNNIERFNRIINSIYRINSNKKEINSSNDLLCMMSLVGYNLNRAIEMGNQIMFYKYLHNIALEYENNKEKYDDIKALYHDFMVAGMERIGYPVYGRDQINKKKVLQCSIQKI